MSLLTMENGAVFRVLLAQSLSHKLSVVTLEFRKECGKDCTLQSLTAINRDGTSNHSTEDEGIEFDHLLRLENGPDILRARTIWIPKFRK